MQEEESDAPRAYIPNTIDLHIAKNRYETIYIKKELVIPPETERKLVQPEDYANGELIDKFRTKFKSQIIEKINIEKSKAVGHTRKSSVNQSNGLGPDYESKDLQLRNQKSKPQANLFGPRQNANGETFISQLKATFDKNQPQNSILSIQKKLESSHQQDILSPELTQNVVPVNKSPMGFRTQNLTKHKPELKISEIDGQFESNGDQQFDFENNEISITMLSSQHTVVRSEKQHQFPISGKPVEEFRGSPTDVDQEGISTNEDKLKVIIAKSDNAGATNNGLSIMKASEPSPNQISSQEDEYSESQDYRYRAAQPQNLGDTIYPEIQDILNEQFKSKWGQTTRGRK